MGFVKRDGGGKTFAMRAKLSPRTVVRIRGHWFSVDGCPAVHVAGYEAGVVRDDITSVLVYRPGIDTDVGYYSVEPVNVVVRRVQPYLTERQAKLARAAGRQFAAMRKAEAAGDTTRVVSGAGDE